MARLDRYLGCPVRFSLLLLSTPCETTDPNEEHYSDLLGLAFSSLQPTALSQHPTPENAQSPVYQSLQCVVIRGVLLPQVLPPVHTTHASLIPLDYY